MPTLVNFPGAYGNINIPREISTQYQAFGTILLKDATGNLVESFEHKYNRDCYYINRAILKHWINNGGLLPVTWPTLIEVLENIEMKELARLIKCRTSPVIIT